MCGIAGSSHTTEATRLMMPVMLMLMQNRGTDSWGVTDGDFCWRSLGKIADSFEEQDLDGPTYHTRGASVGSATLKNAHPFDITALRADGTTQRVVGVHNGHISNWEALKHKYAPARADMEVDSQHIFAHLAGGQSLAELDGWGAVVWYEMDPAAPDARRRYLSKFGRAMDNLHIARLAGPGAPLVFASTREAITIAARFADAEIACFYNIEPKKRYYFQTEADGNLCLAWDMELPWCDAPHVGVKATSAATPFRGGRSFDSEADCATCGQRMERPGRQLLCEKCLTLECLIEYFGQDEWPGLVDWGAAQATGAC